MLIAFSKCKKDNFFSMTDSMNFGPDWIRNLSSESNTGGGTSGGTRYQLADYRYGREEMLALFDRNIKPPACLSNFKSLFAETTLPPLALLPSNDEERVGWQSRPTTLGGLQRGRGGSLERGGRITRGRGGYQSYGRPPNYESGWGNGEPSDWSPRKEYTPRPSSMDNWRRSRNNEEDDGWRLSSGRGAHDKWGRQTSWRGEGEGEERSGPPERGGRSSWHDLNRGPSSRKSWDEDHLPEWANENPLESGGSFDDRGAFHGSDDEQLDGKGGHRRDGLQKSTSQQHISHKQHPPLPTSKSTMSLVKDNENGKNEDSSDTSYNNSDIVSTEHSSPEKERKTSVPEMLDKPSKEIVNSNKERAKSEGPQKNNKSRHSSPEPQRKVEVNDFEKLQEDFLSKLVVDDDPSQQTQTQKSFELSNLPPPPNLAVPGQDKWFYQDPQGQMQGPFTNMEMSEWFKAGYFGQDLKVRRQCDERFFLLGELMAMCGGSNPFQTSVRFPVLKNDISKMPESDLLQFQYLSQLAAYKQAQARVMADPWTALTVQQQELAAQRLIMQQQQVQQDLQYMQQAPPTNPLMHMISQMQQQSNKLPTSGMMEKQPPNMTGGAMDPHVHMQMTNFLSLQNRLPSGLPNHMPAGIPSGVTGPLPPDNLTGISGLPGAGLGAAGMPIPGMPTGLTGGLGLNVPRPSSVEQPTGQDISSLLKQLQQKQQQNQVESLWQQCQFGAPNSGATQPQWPGQVPQEVPMSMWDIQQSSQSPGPVQQQLQQQQLVQKPHPEPAPQTELSQPEKEKAKKSEKTKENRPKDEEKELKKKKKAEEEQQKKDADEKRKQEQRKLEAEKKAEQEKRKKEEERIKKQLEKAKREAEEKRLRELEEKRKLKEQRKLEEEEKKKTEEERRLEEEERIRKEREQREREERERVEERRQEQISMSKVAPWSQANSTFGMSLAEIQKAEKERKAQEAALQAQRLQIERELQLQQQHQQQFEKSGGLQLGWAKKPMETRKVKSLAEIQAEEQERLAKEAAEARLRKDKETRETVQLQATSSIWSGQNLSWSNATSTHSQWMSASNLGFWEEPTQKPQPSKPSTVSKSSSMSTINSSSKQAQQTKPQQKVKPKKEEAAANTKKNHNNNIDDEFTNWCYKALSNMSTTVDIPTFVTFLRDIESAFEVREYCKDYLGESNSTLQFANNFLEKRRSFKPKNAHKDDMCSPAPAITPSTQYSTEFQEVKVQQTKPQQKSKPKKEEAAANTKKNHNNNVNDEFTNWCYKALSNMSTSIDIPTFVKYLCVNESASDVREYCEDYLGESNLTLQFANNFLEKRRLLKSKNTHKDDMCSPAPAMTPSTQYSTEIQEVKEAAETLLRKDKEVRERVQLQTTSGIWSGQNLSWSNASSTDSQCISASNIGFWEEQTQKPQPSKPSSMSTINSSSKQAQQTKPQQKAKPKKEDAAAYTKKNHNNNIDDELANWCYKALSKFDIFNMPTTIDIPVFVKYLRVNESASDVREYCEVYLGESNSARQFANNFLEKRRSLKSKNTYKDDMCSPAPAMTPSTQYSTEYQEVKGKNKKNRKSKMPKVDPNLRL